MKIIKTDNSYAFIVIIGRSLHIFVYSANVTLFMKNEEASVFLFIIAATLTIIMAGKCEREKNTTTA